MAYKRELIINNGSLTSYKKLLKVSDVCQLLDKSKYPATMTMNGVTYTNNGDGTINVKGTRGATGDSYYRITWTQNIIKEHVYCLLGVIKNSGVMQYLMSAGGGIMLYDRGSGDIGTNLINRRELIINLPANTTVDTIVKPQLFDLTEMFGSGNEPKTVAEFKAKFPDELYPYSPNCWLTSYKTMLIVETKNLLDYNKFNMIGKTNYTINSSTGTIIRPQKTSFNNSLFYPAEGADAKLSSVTNLLQLQGTYTFSFKQSDSNILIRKYKVDGTIDDTFPYTTIDISKYSKTITFDTSSYIDLKIENNQSCRIIGLQIEKGTAATNYVPYGYL